MTCLQEGAFFYFGSFCHSTGSCAAFSYHFLFLSTLLRIYSCIHETGLFKITGNKGRRGCEITVFQQKGRVWSSAREKEQETKLLSVN
jgi:hypothetical protein